MKRRDTLNPIVIESPYKTVKDTLNWACNKIKHKKYEVKIYIGARYKRKPLVAVITQFNKWEVTFNSYTFAETMRLKGVHTIWGLHNHPNSRSFPSIEDIKTVPIIKRKANFALVEHAGEYITGPKEHLLSFKRGLELGVKEFGKQYYSPVLTKEYQL